MIYNLKNKADIQSSDSYYAMLKAQGARIEMTKKQNRTLKQNSYLHVLLAAYGLHFGFTESESKALYKALNEDIFYLLRHHY